jgi:serine/threonine protein kinase
MLETPLSEVMILGLSREAKVFYIAEMVAILEFLHLNGIAHRDFKVSSCCLLKPDNLMLDETRHLKVIDFGTARFCGKGSTLVGFKRLLEREIERGGADRKSTFVGTAQYVAPELL